MGGTFGKSGSWVIDNTIDDIPLTTYGVYRVSHGSIINGFEDTKSLASIDTANFSETSEERKGRKRSHWVAYTTVFIMSIGFSIVLTSVWPYLQTFNDNLEKNALGFVVAANPLGQMLASPLLGLWGNKAGKIRGACFVTVFFFILGNAMYALLAIFDGFGSMATYYAMIIARFIVGMSSANVTLCRSYLAQSTTVQERTSGIAIIAASQALGFVVGPGIQTVLILLIPEEVDTGIWWFKWNEYTAAGWTAAALGAINLALLFPCIFTEYSIIKKEMTVFKQKDEMIEIPSPDPLSLAGLLFGFFITIFIYVLVETLAVPFVSDQYGWNDQVSQLVVGVALIVAGLLSTGIFPLTGWLARKFDERLVMLIPGFIPIILGIALFLPYPGHKIPIQECTSYNNDLTSVSPTWNDYTWEAVSSTINETNANCTTGCPVVQEWCKSVPQLPLAQLGVAFLVVMIGYPVVQSIAQGLYSKMLGPRPQGLWMGVLTAIGSLARIGGPIFVSYIYTKFGTYWCFGVLLVAMVIAFIDLILMYPRLIPMQIPTAKEHYAYDGPAVNSS